MPDLRFRSWFRELRRRHVVRVAVGYLAAGFVVIEGVSLLLPAVDVPDGTYRVVVLLVLAGLPVTVALAWAFDLTSEGLVRTGPAARAEPETGRTPLPEPAPGSPIPGRTGAPSPQSRIAVLPFASIQPDREHDYFADGMTEEMISALARIQGLDVIARTSVMRYRDSDTGVAQIARELGVGTILEGSVRKAGDQLRVTAQLIDATTEAHLWAEDYDREFREIFRVQGDIAREVARALELRLLASDREEIERAPTADLEAYDLHLLGRHQLNRRNDEGIRRAIAHFEAALAKDPEFAEARAGLADAWLLGGIGYMKEPPEAALEQARAEAARALSLDDSLPEAHTSLGYAALMTWDMSTAERSFRRAIEINPSHAQAHQWYAHYLSAFSGRYEEAITEFERALELDPLSVVVTCELGWPYGYMGDHERAIVQYEKALEMDPDFALAHLDLGWAYQRLGRLDESIAAYERALELLGGGSFIRGLLGTAYGEAGQEERARAVLAELRAAAEGGAPAALYVGLVHESLGEREQALEWLEHAVEAREPFASGLDTCGDFLTTDELRADPRFQALARRIDELTRRAASGR